MTEFDETLYDIVDVSTMPSTNVNLPMNVVQDILCNPALLKYKMVIGDVSFYVNHNVMGYPGYTVTAYPYCFCSEKGYEICGGGF